MTYVLGPEIARDMPPLPDQTLQRTLSIHSPSVYLQTWFELGMFGAVLLTIVGSSILSAIRSLAPHGATTRAQGAAKHQIIGIAHMLQGM